MTRLIFAAAFVLTACAAAPSADPAAAPQPDVSDDDAWVTIIEAERYGVMIDRATQGAIEGPPAMTAPDPSDRERAAAATQHAAHAIYRLRDIVCAHKTVAPAACGPLPPPAWLGAAPGEEPSWAEIRARIDWVTEHMQPYVDAGCDAGRSRQNSDEPDYCSVE